MVLLASEFSLPTIIINTQRYSMSIDWWLFEGTSQWVAPLLELDFSQEQNFYITPFVELLCRTRWSFRKHILLKSCISFCPFFIYKRMSQVLEWKKIDQEMVKYFYSKLNCIQCLDAKEPDVIQHSLQRRRATIMKSKTAVAWISCFIT